MRRPTLENFRERFVDPFSHLLTKMTDPRTDPNGGFISRPASNKSLG
ncbi:hypothetical protein RBSWK_05776 [Rhodopirellula baltica SWK14]|uniref:Uncharacterized protein n=1 Tax=Rhodopirellula baltica SWK14 TaxID=993516 RepID=L7CB35_RHOBT|nr:hypothetical protein RBSWK_05776 [Rhodopirellula baltica SWK14]